MRSGGLWLFVVVVATTGCHVVFDLERVHDAGAVDAIDSAVDAPPRVPFGAPVAVVELNSVTDDDDPTVTADGLVMVFNSFRNSGDSDLYVSTRATVGDAWGVPVPITELNTTGNENTPKISDDGLTLHLATGTVPQFNIRQTTRPDRSSPWAPYMFVDELNNGGRSDNEAYVLPDGLTVYFSSDRVNAGAYDIYVATRASTSDVWGTPQLFDALNTMYDENGPFTRDGLTFYFSTSRPGSFGGEDLWVARRPAVDQPFVLEPLDELNSSESDEDPWVSPDGNTIWFASGRGTGGHNIYMATR